MGRKSTIRSIRFSDELLELVDRQAGRNFTEKLENLVTRCTWELPKKEEELLQVQEQIREERLRLDRLRETVRRLRETIGSIRSRAEDLQIAIDRQLAEWEM